YKSLAMDDMVKKFVKDVLFKIGEEGGVIVLMMAGAEGFEPIFQAAIEERELKGIDIVKLYSTSQIMDRIEENKYGFSYEDVVESLFGQEGLFKLNKGRVFFIDEIDGAIDREVEKIYNKFKSDEVEVNAWNFPNDEKGSMFCPAPHEYKGLEAIEIDEQGKYRLIFEKNDPERKILHHAVMLALRKGAEEVFKGEASSSILSGSRIKHSVFSMQNTKCDSRTTIHEQRRIAASGVESLDYLEKTRCGWSNRVTSGASPLICTCTIGCPSLSAFSAKERLYLDSSGLDSSTNTITASGEIFSASSGLSNKYFPNSVLSSIFFLINSSSLIFYLLQKLLSICSPVNFEFSIRKSKRFFEIRDVKGNLFLGSISMNDIFMGKPMGSIISYHWLPPILYIYLQLYGKTGNFIFPMSVNVPQLNIISQGNDIFNFFNHKLNIANFKEKVKTILFYAASPLEINTGVVHISLEAVKCDDPEDIFSERKGVRPLLRIDEFLEGITEKIYSAFEELSKRQVIKALQELGYFSLRQKETIAASPMKNKVSSALSAYQFSEEIRLVFLRRNVETYRMLERIEAIHFGYKGALCEKIKILNEKGVQPVKILDVGAGKGKFLTGLNKEAERRNLKIKTYALEVKSHNLLREKNSRIIWEESRWEESRITGYLPKKWQGKFVIVLGTYVLEYIYDPLRMIEEIYCALRPEGEVYLSLNLLNEDRYKECQEDIKKSWASEQCGIYKQRGKLYFENISFFTEISRLKKIGYSIGFCIKKGSMGKVVPEEVDQNLWDLFQLKGKQALETLWRQLARLNLFNLFASNWGCDYMTREKKNGKWEIFSIDAGGSFNFKTFERFKEQPSHLLKVGASYYLDCCPEVLINIADLHRDVIEKVIHGLFTEELMDWIGQKYPRLYASGINQDIRLFIYNSQALVNEVLANEIIQARKLVSSPIFFQGLGIKEKGLSIQYSEFSSKDPRLEIKNSELNRRLRRAEVRFGTQAWLVWGLAPAAPPIFLFYIFIVNNVSLRRLGSLRWAKTGPPSISRQSPAFSPQVVVPFFLLSTIPARGWFASGGNHQLLAIKSAASPVEADLHIHTIYSDGVQFPWEIVTAAMRKGLKAIAITDHDIFEGIEEALEARRGFSLEIIPGIEWSTNEKGVEILCYFPDTEKFLADYKAGKFNSRLIPLTQAREKRMAEMIKKAQELGAFRNEGIIVPHIEEFKEEVAEITPFRYWFIPGALSVYLWKKYKDNFNRLGCKSPNDVYNRYLIGQGLLGPFETELDISPGGVAEYAKEVGGLSVLAHPKDMENKGRRTKSEVKEFIFNLARRKLIVGVQVDDRRNSRADTLSYVRMVKEWNKQNPSWPLVMISGSDHHSFGPDYNYELGCGRVDKENPQGNLIPWIGKYETTVALLKKKSTASPLGKRSLSLFSRQFRP
ncbi:MAG: PHP domain-containing protein, partial [Candidatus Omnitrophica bacterium]|nr:PHP domain-containing protein [Candidatus Omnitrophota bacterium]